MDDPLVGLKVGLEIHQQLSGTKLFCRCPADAPEEKPDLIITRQLRAAAGETGAVDTAAAAEQAKGKLFTYHAHHTSSCLVELDEEPPHDASPEAITTAVMTAKALGSTILPRVQFMRKTIVDGSAVSGFQRTALLALGGKVPGHDVRVQTVCVEEDAAKILARTTAGDTYDLSRLGIPLIEIATDPDITTPEQAQEVAATIGMILRSTRRVKRGLGTIRQDLNVSIPGGTRIEIKGCQDLRMIPTFIRNEAIRQHALVALSARVPAFTASSSIDVTKECKTGSGFLKSALAKGAHAVGMRCDGYVGVFGTEICPGYRVGSELADLVRSWGFGGIIHSDEDMKKYGLDIAHLREAFSCGAKDAFLILVGEPALCEHAFRDLVIPRVKALAHGVPREVRKANPDGTTSFLRPMPGGARMYPETDILLVEVDVSRIKAPVLLSDQRAELQAKTGLSEDIARQVIDQDIPIEEYKTRFPSLEYSYLSSVLIEWPTEIATRTGKRIENPQTCADLLLPKVVASQLASSSIKAILEDLATGKGTDVLAIAKGYEAMPDSELKKIVQAMLAKHGSYSNNAVMGEIMKQVRGKADGKRIMAMIEELR